MQTQSESSSSEMSRDPIVVIGGGPAGSTCASLLKEHGHDVILLEKCHFPRFHIGESLLTYSQDYFERLGLADALKEVGFKVKGGGEARVGKHPDKTGFFRSTQYFWKVPRSVKPKRPWAYQVERAKFDEWLLRRAQEKGVVVHEGAKVEAFEEGDRPKVTWRDEHGEVHETYARYVVDASGRHAVIARKLGHFVKETNYMTSSVFGQFEGIKWPDDERGGFINVYFLQDGWIWFIPLGEKTSVGIVMNETQTKNWPREPQQVFNEIVGRFDYLRDRFGPDAKQLGPIRILRNLPYYSEEVRGKGWAQCGDAAMFVDPIHSSGIHLAFYSATTLADELHAHLSGDDKALDRYEKKVRSHHKNVRYNVSLYYKVVQFRYLMYWFVRGTGDFSLHWSGPILRRVNAWSFGNYSKFIWAMKCFWAAAHFGLFVFGLWHKLTGTDRWGKHGFQAPIKPFSVPRVDVQPELQGRSIALPSPEAENDEAFHLEPGHFNPAAAAPAEAPAATA